MSTEKPVYTPLIFLIVHDSPEDLYMLAKVFQEARIWNKIYVLRRGADVLPFLNKLPPFENKKSPDVIFIKHTLPDMSVHKIIEQVAKDPRFSGVKVVMLIDGTDDTDDQSFSLDAEIVLNMPVKAEKLFEVMRSLNTNWCTFGRVEMPASLPTATKTVNMNEITSDSSVVGAQAITR
ncbi:MAG TPA: hypothetical protein VMG59_04695 [Phycisphaerae bacterium]|nr:hypothetical protein [Phycisphaerae bacterium]